jgi:RNA polymerase sigma-70 factor (ECF subfamily)
MADSSGTPNGIPATPGLFPATAWTLVQRALDAADGAQPTALNELCARYWRPIYIYLRRGGRPIAEAEDLSQAFFVHLLEKQLLERVRVRQVRFRAYLRSVLEHFLANEARTARAQKRQGAIAFDVAGAESWLAACPQESPETAFDSMWAIERLEAALARLRQELRHAGREWVAETLMQRAGFGPAAGATSVRDLAKQHGVNENQLSVALHRARERLRALILDEIRDSVSSPEEAAQELRDMFAVLQQRRP